MREGRCGLGVAAAIDSRLALGQYSGGNWQGQTRRGIQRPCLPTAGVFHEENPAGHQRVAGDQRSRLMQVKALVAKQTPGAYSPPGAPTRLPMQDSAIHPGPQARRQSLRDRGPHPRYDLLSSCNRSSDPRGSAGCCDAVFHSDLPDCRAWRCPEAACKRSAALVSIIASFDYFEYDWPATRFPRSYP